MRWRGKTYLMVSLIVYVVCAYLVTVLTRETSAEYPIYLDLFGCYSQPDRGDEIIVNIVAFVPIGVLVALFLHKGRVIWATLVGLLVSAAIEFSQLQFQRGVFDVDDIFNNTLGAVIGGVVAVVYMALRKNENGKRSLNE